MQHSTQVYQARVPFIKKKKIKKNYTVLKFGKLEYCVIFFFLKGTRAWYTRVLCKWYSSLPSLSTAKNFLITQIQLSSATVEN